MTNLIRRSFIKGMFASIAGFLGIGGASAGVNNWAKMDDNNESDDSVTEQIQTHTKSANKSEKVTGKFNPSSIRDHTVSSFFGNSVKCEISGDTLYLKQGKNTITVEKNKLWSDFGPLFEVIEPSVYITLNADDTINNIWSPQNLAIGLAKRDEKYELQPVNVKVDYNINKPNPDVRKMGCGNAAGDGSTFREVYPYIPDEGINVVQERYDSMDNVVNDKKTTPWDVSKNGWRIYALEPVRVKLDGQIYMVCENKDGRFLIEETETDRKFNKATAERIQKDHRNKLTIDKEIVFKNGEKAFKTPVLTNEMVDRMSKRKGKITI